MKDNKTSEIKKFFAQNPLSDTQIKEYEPGYELTAEYEIIKNPKTNKDEFYLKEGGKVMSVGAVRSQIRNRANSNKSFFVHLIINVIIAAAGVPCQYQ